METQANVSVLVSFVVYTIAIVFVGLWASRKAHKSNEEFYLAGRGLGAWVSAFSASASSESGWLMLGLVGLAFADGLSAFWVIPGCLVGYLFNWLFVAKRLRKQSIKFGALTLPDYIEALIGGSVIVRVLAVVIIVLAMMGYVAAQFNAAGKTFESVFGVNYSTGVLIGAFIVLVYTVSGGFRAVSFTDFVQALLMVMALVLLPVLILGHLGGFSGMLARLRAQDPALLSFFGKGAGVALVIGHLGIGLGYPGMPHVLVRFMAAKDDSAIKRGSVIAFIWGLLSFSGAVLLGLSARALVGAGGIADPEHTLPVLSVQMLPSVIAGMMLAAVLAAICSTADSQLLVAASAVASDLVKLSRKELSLNAHRVLNVATVLVLGVLAVIFALSKNRVVFWFVLYAWAVLGAAFGPIVIWGVVKGKISNLAAIASLVVGSITPVVWKSVLDKPLGLYELVPAFVLSFAVVAVVEFFVKRS